MVDEGGEVGGERGVVEGGGLGRAEAGREGREEHLMRKCGLVLSLCFVFKVFLEFVCLFGVRFFGI